ncbi:MAG: glycosyltransferase family 39 protein [Planctomycetota bacterium]|nr:glycosyltransferase family 39 protein [Planctomycetota bacterium]
MTGSFLSPRARDALAVSVLAGFLFFHNIAHREIRRPSEGRVARVAQEILDTGDWVVPHLNGQPRLQKPPMSSWLVAICTKLSGHPEVTVQDALVPPALSAVALAVLLYFWLARLRRDGEGEGDGDGESARAAGMFGALALVMMPAVIGQGRCAEMDMFVALCTAAAYFCFERAWFDGARGWWIGFYLALAAGFLTKGHVILVDFLPAVLVWGLWQKFAPRNPPAAAGTSSAAAPRRLQFSLQSLLVQVLGLGLFFALVLAWGLPFLERSGMTWEAFKTEGLARFSEKTTGHVEAWHFYFANVPPWTMPAFLLLPYLAWRDWTGPEDEHKPRRRLWWCWLGVNVLLWSLLAAKQRHYTIPWYPAVALLAGDGLVRLLRQARAENPLKRLMTSAGAYVFVGLWALAAGALAVYANTTEARRDAEESPAAFGREVRRLVPQDAKLYDLSMICRPHVLFYVGRNVHTFSLDTEEGEGASKDQNLLLILAMQQSGEEPLRDFDAYVLINDELWSELKSELDLTSPKAFRPLAEHASSDVLIEGDLSKNIRRGAVLIHLRWHFTGHWDPPIPPR